MTRPRGGPCSWLPFVSRGLGHSAHWHHFLLRSLLEESYVMRDPFTPDKDRFLILGSRCGSCGRLVCVGPVGKPRAAGAAFPLSLWLGPHVSDCERGDT